MTVPAEHRVTASTVVGGLHADAVRVIDHITGVGIHIETVDGAHVSLFGTLDALVAVTSTLARELARIAAARIPDPTAERLGATS